MKKRIAILGGGPSGLFVYQRLLESGRTDFSVDIFEASNQLGAGMPYSEAGANQEHVTNVSGNEIPALVTPLADWLDTLDAETLKQFHFKRDGLNDYRVLPRLLFGKYLQAQFELLLLKAKETGVETTVHFGRRAVDIVDEPGIKKMTIKFAAQASFTADCVIICTGHHWPREHEDVLPGYFDSPYPPSKLKKIFNHRIALRGSSLTAIDAVRTLARMHGKFFEDGAGRVLYQPHDDAKDFKIIMHSRSGLLPAIRFHLDDPHLSKESLLAPEELNRHMAENNGFLSLDFVFEKDFKDSFREKDPAFYKFIEKLGIEEFVEAMMKLREGRDPFQLFKEEYAEAKKSIRRKEPIYWKEMLAVLSFAMNYPAKHLSAEDMLRLQRVLMPLISVVIAFAPQRSCEELIALHDAGRLELIGVGPKSRVDPHPDGGVTYRCPDEAGRSRETRYQTYVDCVGQPHLALDQFPFKSLVKMGVVAPARLKFRSAERARQMLENGEKEIAVENDGDNFLQVPGIAINDNFQAVNARGEGHARLYVMAVPFIGGFNPDYSGLDFCEEAAKRIVDSIWK